jgi:hypothetical protein
VPNRFAKTDAGSRRALIAARTFGVGRRLRVKMGQQGSTPFRLAGKQSTGLFRVPPHSLGTDLAINKGIAPRINVIVRDGTTNSRNLCGSI